MFNDAQTNPWPRSPESLRHHPPYTPEWMAYNHILAFSIQSAPESPRKLTSEGVADGPRIGLVASHDYLGNLHERLVQSQGVLLCIHTCSVDSKTTTTQDKSDHPMTVSGV